MKFSSELAKLDCAVALERLGGDEELLREVASLFLDEYPMLMREIRIAATTRDAEALQRAAHSMKGSVSNFGADGVYQAAFVLEKKGRAGDLESLDSCIDQLAQALEHIHPALVVLSQV
ncbi:MAG TPA: Hpt domain-containing protein [Bryobacteraceae bacterium]|nr:Hpt domain-containing protein [Bryobacteraceae bacterium]